MLSPKAWKCGQNQMVDGVGEIKEWKCCGLLLHHLLLDETTSLLWWKSHSCITINYKERISVIEDDETTVKLQLVGNAFLFHEKI